MPGVEQSRLCRAGLHEIPPGQDRCGPCRNIRSRQRRTAQAYPGVARPCPSGRHTIPAGHQRCRECKREDDRGRNQLAGVLRAEHLPLAEVLDGAACTPELAYLFDVGAPKNEKAAESRRHRAARDICAGCPVAAACRADALAGRQLGVYGGVVMDQGFWSLHGRGLVQDVPVVPDSSAC